MTAAPAFPPLIPNWIGGVEAPAAGEPFPKLSPASGEPICRVARSGEAEVAAAVAAARAAQPEWAALTPIRRGELLRELCIRMKEQRSALAEVVALETGKSRKGALGETDAATALGFFYAGEGQRLYGRTTTSGMPNRMAMTVREPVGVAALIVASNTPIANVAWKAFPALICGNGAVLKASEDTPITAWLFGRLAHEAGIPGGVLNVVQGLGAEAGAALVASELDLISFTGSTAVGRRIAASAGERLIKCSMELGGKNAFVVCDDADLENAVQWALLSAFSNAGQRCAAGSRLVVMDAVYEAFRVRLLERTRALTLGPGDEHDLGPVINERQLTNMCAAVEAARAAGCTVLCGGGRLKDEAHRGGFYMQPTLIEGADPAADISTCELFGPIANLYRVSDFAAALALANDSPYGLTCAIHTANVHRAITFARRMNVGVASINGGTFGSEAHMPFGGPKASGNGFREPGTEALDVYSELKDIYLATDPAAV